MRIVPPVFPMNSRQTATTGAGVRDWRGPRPASALVMALVSSLLGARAIPGTSVSLDPPPGLQAAERFAGFASATETVSILVTEMPAPLTPTLAGFDDAAKLAARRMTMDSREKVKLTGGETAELIRLKQRDAGSEYRKLILAAGDEKRTVLVTATCEMEAAEK